MKEGENRFHYESPKDGWLQEVLGQVKKEGVEAQGPMRLDLSFTKLEPDYYLKGDLKYQLEQPCSRCAEPVKSPISHHFELAFSHLNHPREEADESNEEIDIIFFHGNELEIDPVISEQVLLSVPYLSLCRGDCKGICQKCGKNLNDGTCACRKEAPDGPFSKLNEIKSKVDQSAGRDDRKSRIDQKPSISRNPRARERSLPR